MSGNMLGNILGKTVWARRSGTATPKLFLHMACIWFVHVCLYVVCSYQCKFQLYHRTLLLRTLEKYFNLFSSTFKYMQSTMQINVHFNAYISPFFEGFSGRIERAENVRTCWDGPKANKKYNAFTNWMKLSEQKVNDVKQNYLNCLNWFVAV